MKQIKKSLVSLTALGTAIGVLSGCTASIKTTQELEKNQDIVKKDFEGSYVKSSAAAASNSESNVTNFGKSTKNWVDPMPLPRVEKEKELPEFFKKKISMTMPGTIMVSEVLSEMQRSVGIKFILTPDVYDASGGVGTILSSQGGAGAQQKKANPLMVFDFVYNGSLEKGLDLLCAKINLSWKWNGNAIEIYRYDTKTYNISALSGVTEMSSNVDLKGDTTKSTGGSGGGGGATGGTSTSNVSRKSNITTWEEVKTYILAQLSPGGSMAVLESTGSVTIKDIPLVHKRIDKAISDLNAKLTRQIYLNVDIYAVNRNDSDDVGLDLSSVAWNNSSKFTGITYNKVGTGPVSGVAGNFNIGVAKQMWGNPQFVVRALSTLGETSIVNQFAVTTLSGQPTPIATNRKVGYLKKRTSSTDATTGAVSVSLDPDEISEGINLNVTPKIEPAGDILLEYAMNLSQLEELKSFPSATDPNMIQLPTSTLKSMLQRAVLRSGETLVLSGFKQKTANMQKSGTGHPSNILMGGGQKADTSYQYLVITVTPYIANNNSNNR